MGRRFVCLCLGILTLVAACDDDQSTMPAADPPTISTGTAISVGRTQATVLGTIDPHSVSTLYWFEYGSDTDYGTRTPDVHMSTSVSGTQEVAAPLGGLEPSTDYHYRLVARNSGGTATGLDATFRTLNANQPPDTHLVAAPPDTVDTTVSWHLYWHGTDSDGGVAGFELRIANHGEDGMLDPADSLGVRWMSTVVTDSVVAWQNGLGNRTAWVRALDYEGARDPTPASLTLTGLE